MKLLLDTHAFIWWDGDQTRLPMKVLAACESPANTLHLSLASVWEMQIKAQLGKLALRLPCFLISTFHFLLSTFPESSILALSKLPSLHRDPFDRMLIVQAQRRDFQIVSHDAELLRYGVATLW